MGKPVPQHRMKKGYAAVREMLPNVSWLTAYSIVSKTAHMIRKDSPFDIIGATSQLDKDLVQLDLTGRYRLLAELCTD